ncbi:MAG: hypothetical protein JNK74_02420 [Candidatus Hydrogenedentes bacterium]|nr:hypothetical protein [Candidatus Hydrogenedentota bacterium]
MTNYSLIRFLPLAGLLLGLSCSRQLDPSAVANAGDSPAVAISAAPASIGSEPPPSETGDGEEQIKAIMAQCKAAREGIRSYRLHIKWRTWKYAGSSLAQPLPDGQVVSEGEGVWIEEGDKWRVHHSRRKERAEFLLSPDLPSSAAPPPELPQGEFQYWAAYDGEDYAKRTTQHGLDELLFFPGPVVRAGEHVIVGPSLFPFPLKWGFGSGSDYLDELYRKSVEKKVEARGIWDVEYFTDETGSKIRLNAYHSREKRAGRMVEYVLDPERDFQVVYVAGWDRPGGMKTMEKRKTLQQLADGRWFPDKVSHRHEDLFKEWEYSNVEFNISLDPSVFTMNGFGLGPSVTMHRRNTDGSTSRFLFRDDQWVPEAFVPQSERPEMLRAH